MKKYVQLIFAAVFFIFFIWLVLKFSELKIILHILKGAVWYYLVLAVIFQLIFFLNQSILYSSLFRIFKIRVSSSKIMPLVLIASFFDLSVPTGGFSGILMFVIGQIKLGVRAATSFLVALLYHLFYYSVFLFFLLISLIYLFFQHNLTSYQIWTAIFFFIFIVILILVSVLILQSPKRLNNFLTYVLKKLKFLSSVFKVPSVEKTQIESLISQTFQFFKIAKENPRDILKPTLWAFLLFLWGALILGLVFLMFGYKISLSALLVSYTIGFMFTVFSITPSGLGFTETAMTFVLVSLKVPIELASLVTLVFRFFSFWLPFFLGFATFRIMKKKFFNI